MEAAPAIDTSSPAPPPVASEPDVGNVVAPPSSPPVVDAPSAPSIETGTEVPIDLDHPIDQQPDLRESFPQQPQPEREQPQPQQPQPQLEPLALPDVFDPVEADAWNTLPRQTQEILTHVVEHTKARLAPQIEAATAVSNAHHEALWGAIGVHSKRAAALVEMARTNPQGLEQLARSPDGQRLIAELGQERAAIQNHGRQIVEQLQEAKRAESEQFQSHFDNVWAPQQDDAFWDRMAAVIPPDQQEALQDQAVETLRDAGFSEDEIREGYERSGMMRDARSQIVIAKAALWDQAQARQAAAKEAAQRRERERSRSISPPLRPGSGGGIQAPAQTLAAAAASGDMGTYLALRARGATR